MSICKGEEDERSKKPTFHSLYYLLLRECDEYLFGIIALLVVLVMRIAFHKIIFLALGEYSIRIDRLNY